MVEAGAIDELLRGGLDIHTHSSPSAFARTVSDFELAEQARAAGLRAVVIKAHEVDTTYRAALVSKVVTGIDVLGGIVLNHFVGGLNPEAVDLALKVGARMIWMPTISAHHHIAYCQGQEFRIIPAGPLPAPPKRPIKILDDEGRLLPAVHEIIAMLAEADVCLGTGHLSPTEIDVLVDAAREAGLRRILITHADLGLTGMPLSQQVELARKGVFIEKCFVATMPRWGSATIAGLASSIREIGHDRCVLVTDCGQVGMPKPADGLRAYVGDLLAAGVRADQVSTMLAKNPAYLIGLPS